MRSMTHDETRAFLSGGTRTGKLATIRADGRPHVVPIWFVLDGDVIIFTTWHTSVKGKNLLRDRRAALAVDDQAPPYSYVMVEGTIEIVDDLAALRLWATRIAARYMGADLAESYGARNGVSGELLVRLTPTHTVAQAGVAD